MIIGSIWTAIGNFFSGGFNSLVKSIFDGINSLFTDAIKALFHYIEQAMTALTSPHFNSPGIQAMFNAAKGPAMIVSGIILIIALVDSAMHGDMKELGKRVAAAPIVVAITLASVTGLGTVAIILTNWMSNTMLNAALPHGGGATASVVVLAGFITGATLTDPLLGILIGVFAILLLLAIFVELVIRGAMLDLAFVLIPLALAGVFWKNTEAWTKKIIDVMVALLFSQVIIYTFLGLGVALLTNAAHDFSSLVIGVGVLALAAFSLPMALKLAPHTTSAASHFGSGGQHAKKLAMAAGSAGATVATGGAAAPAAAGAGAGAGAGVSGAGISSLGTTGTGVVDGASRNVGPYLSGQTSSSGGSVVGTGGGSVLTGDGAGGGSGVGAGGGSGVGDIVSGDTGSGNQNSSLLASSDTPEDGDEIDSTTPDPNFTEVVPGVPALESSIPPGEALALVGDTPTDAKDKMTSRQMRHKAVIRGIRTAVQTGHVPSGAVDAAVAYHQLRKDNKRPTNNETPQEQSITSHQPVSPSPGRSSSPQMPTSNQPPTQPAKSSSPQMPTSNQPPTQPAKAGSPASSPGQPLAGNQSTTQPARSSSPQMPTSNQPPTQPAKAGSPASSPGQPLAGGQSSPPAKSNEENDNSALGDWHSIFDNRSKGGKEPIDDKGVTND